MLTISSLSLEYVKVPVSATVAGAAYNPTGDTVQLAFKASGVNPGSSDWQSGSWETQGAGTALPTYYARCLVGPGGTITLAAGVYVVWVKITDNPEVPVLVGGDLTVL